MMYEDRERFSWTNLFIKVIIVVIFVLFTIWLLSLSMKSATRGMSNGINVLTENVFSQNIDRMKEVGQSYFTTERLPEKVGEVKTLTLEEMYKKNLILEVKDKNGNACSMDKSYVSVEKLDTEYQMKVYLDCGDEVNFIKVIMGCYNYCDDDICEKKEQTKALEYEYAKTTGAGWGPWGNFTGWSTEAVSGNDGRVVETKVVNEPYTYYDEKIVTQEVGTANVCPKVDGYTLTTNKDGVCTYSKTTGSTSTNPTCPKVDGYTNTGRSGFTCNYSKTSTSTVSATATTTGGDPIYGKSCHKVAVGTKIVSACTGCAKEVQTVYETRCNTVVTGYTEKKTTYSCPSGYTLSGTNCTKTGTSTTTKDATCPSGYSKSGNSCVKAGTTSTTTKNATCPDGQRISAKKCYKDVTTSTPVEGTRDVNYYRYKTRDYNNGTTDIKWSKSNNDKSLLNAGYKLTGKTREVGGSK